MAYSLSELDELIAYFDKQRQNEKIVFVSMEFVLSTVFSGNGVYARTIVSALLGSNFEVLVICASNQIKTSLLMNETLENNKECTLLIIPVNEWKHLNYKCDYQLFGTNFISNIKIFDKFKPNHLLFVDFSALIVVENIMKCSSNINITKLNKIFLNFRVFYNKAQDKKEKDLYLKLERKCCEIANIVVALNENELLLLKQLCCNGSRQFCVLHPPLRVDVEQIALKLNKTKNKERKYFLCCCRISKEKNVQIFIKCVEMLQEFLSQNKIIPYLCGSANDTNKEYMDMLYDRLKAAKCECMLSPFMPHQELCTDVYDKTLLNLHPAITEPYGMVLVECAAHCVPSITHKHGIGANELLVDATFKTDMTDPQSVAKAVKMILQNPTLLSKIGEKAKCISLHYNITTFAERLKQLI